jgi:hypothetical protein
LSGTRLFPRYNGIDASLQIFGSHLLMHMDLALFWIHADAVFLLMTENRNGVTLAAELALPYKFCNVSHINSILPENDEHSPYIYTLDSVFMFSIPIHILLIMCLWCGLMLGLQNKYCRRILIPEHRLQCVFGRCSLNATRYTVFSSAVILLGGNWHLCCASYREFVLVVSGRSIESKLVSIFVLCRCRF